MRKIERELRKEFPFAEIETSGGGHLRITLPNGRSVFAASTPADLDVALANIRKDVRRARRCDEPLAMTTQSNVLNERVKQASTKENRK